MTEPRSIEDLIHAEIDGHNTPEESARLKRLLERDPTWREEFRNLRDFSELLSRVPPVEPPEGFRRGVMAALSAPVRKRASSFTGPVGRVRRTFWGHAYAAAAGIALGIVLGPWVWHLVRVREDPAAMLGTLAPREALERPAPIIDIPLEPAGVEAVVRVHLVRGGCIVEVVNAPASVLESALRFDEAALVLAGYRRDTGRLEGLAVGPGEARWRQEPGQRVVIEFERLDDAPTDLGLEIGPLDGARRRITLAVPAAREGGV